jgi:hypothetical protein
VTVDRTTDDAETVVDGQEMPAFGGGFGVGAGGSIGRSNEASSSGAAGLPPGLMIAVGVLMLIAVLVAAFLTVRTGGKSRIVNVRVDVENFWGCWEHDTSCARSLSLKEGGRG